jgi:hypothetical protein
MLGLEVVRTRGRAAREAPATLVRALEPADLSALSTERGVTAPPLKRVKDRHHALARALASGMAPGVAAVAVGIQGSTVSILCADPAFKELLAFYRSETDAAYRSLHEELSGISMDAAAEIRKRLEDDEMVGKMSLDTLTELVKMGADRTGFGPQSKSTNVNVTVDFGARLEAARRRVAERKVIDVTPGASNG